MTFIKWLTLRTKNPIIDQIKNNKIFCHLTDAELEKLAGFATRRTLKKGQILALQGSEWRAVLHIISGLLVSVILTPDGRRHIVTSWEKNEDFWSHTTFDGEPLLASLEAAKNSVIYQWPGEVVLDLVIHNQAATRALLVRKTRLLRKRRQNIYDLAFNQINSRIAKIILEQFSNTETETIQRDFTLGDMAARAATSPEVVCRTLSRFESEGYLNLTRASITLQNRSGLENLIDEQL